MSERLEIKAWQDPETGLTWHYWLDKTTSIIFDDAQAISPQEDGRPTIPAETKILGVTVADGVCYVNLDQTFSDMALNQQEEIPIYSITNSLVESGSVTQVQIAINGETKKPYREHVSLDQLFHARTDLVEQGEADE